jgi:hypothetical protein
LSAASQHITRWWGAAALVVGVAVAAGLGQTSVGHGVLGEVGLFEEPASYTSLAFLHPQSWPEQLKSKRANVGISFVIHNAGSTARDYQWSVLLDRGQKTRHVDAGTLRVAAGRGAAIIRTAEISCTRGRVRIIVSLARPAESIDAWTACWAPRR